MHKSESELVMYVYNQLNLGAKASKLLNKYLIQSKVEVFKGYQKKKEKKDILCCDIFK